MAQDILLSNPLENYQGDFTFFVQHSPAPQPRTSAVSSPQKCQSEHSEHSSQMDPFDSRQSPASDVTMNHYCTSDPLLVVIISMKVTDGNIW